MRTWMINLVVSGLALIAVPCMFLVLSGALSGSRNAPVQQSVNPFGDPFAGIPQGYLPQFGFPRPVQRPVLTEDMQRQKCVSDLAGVATIDAEYREPFCGCLAKLSYYTAGPAGRGDVPACRTTVLADLAKRPDVQSAFEAKFARICTARYLDRDDRIDDAKAQDVCGCMRTRIEGSPQRAAAIGFTGGESDGNRALNQDLDICEMQTQAFRGQGWQIEARDGARVAVLQTPGNYDIASMTLACTSDNAMRLEVAYRTHGRRAEVIKRDPSTYTNGWQIHLQDGVAIGKEAAGFYQMVVDDQEKSGGPPNGTTDFGEMMPDGRGGEYEALFGDVKNVVAPVLQACLPKPGGNFVPPAVTAAAALPGVAPDKWTYAGRSAQFPLDLPADGIAPLTILQFSCEADPPYLELAGSFTDDARTRDRLKISLGANASLTMKMSCEDNEGVACMAALKGDQLARLAAAPAIALSVGGKLLATVPFGSSEGVRKTFPYCKMTHGPSKPELPPVQPGAVRPRIVVGGTYTLANAMNLRATAAADGRILRSLPVGTTLAVVRQVTNARGEAWSAISVLGSQAGYVNDAALSFNAAAAGGAPLSPTHRVTR